MDRFITDEEWIVFDNVVRKRCTCSSLHSLHLVKLEWSERSRRKRTLMFDEQVSPV